MKLQKLALCTIIGLTLGCKEEACEDLSTMESTMVFAARSSTPPQFDSNPGFYTSCPEPPPLSYGHEYVEPFGASSQCTIPQLTTDPVTVLPVASEGSSNNQVGGIDEADVLKTNSDYLVYAKTDEIKVISQNDLQEIGTISLETNQKRKIHLIENYLVVIYQPQDDWQCPEGQACILIARYVDATKAKVYDLKKLNQEPKTFDFTGTPVTSRLVGNQLNLVTRSDIYSQQSQTHSWRNNNCQGLQKSFWGKDIYSVTSVFSLKIKGNESKVLSDHHYSGDVKAVYQNDHLNLGFSTYYPRVTTLLQLTTDKKGSREKSVGWVRGHLIGQWALHEQEGRLFAATTDGRKGNQLFEMRDNDGQLTVNGSIENLAPQEDIRAVRYFNNTAYLVTFERVDPLFVIDISEKGNPELKGELKIPGFSSYLHPVSDNLLVGLGVGENFGLQLSLFDVSNPHQPKALQQFELNDSYSEAQHNHLAFSYFKEHERIAIPITGSDNSAQIYQVQSNQLLLESQLSHAHARIRRVIESQGRLLSFSDWGFKVHDRTQPEQVVSTYPFD